MKKTDRIIVIIAGLIVLAGCFIFFQFYYPYHLFYREQVLLFLYTPDYIFSYFDHPAWLSCLAGDYLTQYFYLIGGGAVILSLTLLLMGGTCWWCCRKFFPDKIALLLALLLTGYEIGRNFDLHYELSSTISLLGGMGMFLAHEWLVRKKKEWIWLSLLLLPFTYCTFGYGVWIYLLFLIVYSFLKTHQYLFPVAGIAIVVVFSLVLRGKYLLTPTQSFLYPSATLRGAKPDNRMEKFLALDTEAYFENWPKVKQLAIKSKMKTSYVSYYYNLAQSMQGRLPDGLLDFYQPGPLGLFQEVSQNNSNLGIWASNEVWFRLGDMTLAEHSAILGMIFSPHHRSSRMIKRMAEINLIKDDYDAAAKFLKILSQTKFYKKWAKRRLDNITEENLPFWLEFNRKNISTFDILRFANDYPVALRHLLDSNPENIKALDYLLCYHLLRKDLRSFIGDFDQYAGHYTSFRIYSEALLIYLAITEATPQEMESYSIHSDIIREFNEYTRLYEQYGGNLKPLQTRYGNTYWFYYHFATFVNNEN